MGEDDNQDLDQDQEGRFVAQHTDDDVLAAVDEHEPAATSEVGAELGIARQSADYRLRKLADDGRVRKKKIGASLVWFLDEDPPTEDIAASGSSPTTETESAELAGVEFPATKDRDECAAAVRAARDVIREAGGASKGEIVAEVMPEHPLGYDVEKARTQVETEGERFRGAWWRRIVKPGLEALPDVEKPPQGGSEWQYVGEGE